jgi:uncharacterized protein
VKLNDKVMVKVMEVDKARKRIALSIKQTQEAPLMNRPRKVTSRLPFDMNSQNKHSKMEKQKDNMEDAMSLLRKKFGKMNKQNN